MKKMLKNITIILAGASSIYSCNNSNSGEVINLKKTVQDSVVEPKQTKDSIINWKEINLKQNHIIEKMAYADTGNFMHEKIYPCAKCFLRPEAAYALLKANEFALNENLHLVIYDCYRPKIYQQKMYDIVRNTKYIANPTKGSNHNKGLAVDIGLADSNGVSFDMGSAFDDFSNKAHFTNIYISAKAKNNRKKLRAIMTQAGFEPYENEWWHFNYSNVTYPVDEFIWDCH